MSFRVMQTSFAAVYQEVRIKIVSESHGTIYNNVITSLAMNFRAREWSTEVSAFNLWK